MSYVCLECGHRARVARGGRCPSCESPKITVKSDNNNQDSPPPAAHSRLRLGLLASVWLVFIVLLTRNLLPS